MMLKYEIETDNKKITSRQQRMGKNRERYHKIETTQFQWAWALSYKKIIESLIVEWLIGVYM